ncbi:hypothetical protein ACF0H5_005830 [Mactra antiquata]
MSFSGSAGGVPGLNLKKFESQSEVDEKRQKRQEEWEKVRKPDDPEECPEAPVDNRCLYDKLEEQRLKKEEEHEEKTAFRNQVRRLDADETEFLDFCSEQNKVEDKKPTNAVPTKQQGKKSQAALLVGAVKRKGPADVSSNKKSKTEDTDLNNETSNTETNTESSAMDSKAAVSNHSSQLSKVIGVLPASLPGLTNYDDSSDSISTSDDSDTEFTLAGRNTVIVKQVASHSQQ